MVARTPPKQKKIGVAMAPLSPTLIRETLKKVDQCMTRLQELQYTVTGGNKVVSGVTLSPRSTRGYLKASLRCKQESIRTRTSASRKSPAGKLPASTAGEWRRMSLPAMLVGETVGEILQASQFTKEIMQSVSKLSNNKNLKNLASLSSNDDPKTPVSHSKTRTPKPKNTNLEARRKREKLHKFQIIQRECNTPSLQRAKSRITFKVSPPKRKGLEFDKENCKKTSYLANRVSPKNKPWAKKTVLFPNPLFHSSPTSKNQKFSRTKSPVIPKSDTQNQNRHMFLIKSPNSGSKFQVKIKTPPKMVNFSPPKRAGSSLARKRSPMKVLSDASSRLRRSLSPSRVVSRLVSPLKNGRKDVQKNSNESLMMMMSGLKQRPSMAMMKPARLSAPGT